MIKTQHMMAAHIIACLCGALLLSSCASTDAAKTATPNGVAVDVLAPRNLAPGECGLFVWAGEARRFILFSQAGEGAILARGGEDVSLSPTTGAQDADLYGQVPIQSFSDPDGKAYDLRLSSPSELEGGMRYVAGTWKHKDSAGWEVLTPVYGLSTCRAA